MTGTLDSFDFTLAQDLSRTLGEVRAMPNSEVVEWRAYYRYHTAMDDLARRSGRR